ncbi:MAG: YceH family protein [Ignavibacteriaceae bacterium]
MNLNEIVLTAEEVRVIGALTEKELTTPEYYPLTLNSLVNACNQKSNREPVVNYPDVIVEEIIDSLREKGLVRRVTGSDMRVPKYKQGFTEEYNFSPEETAVMCILMLRGAQTLGEIKVRTGRMYNFESLMQVEDVLRNLANREKPLVTKLPKQTGMKESRYTHLLSGEPVIESVPAEEEVEISKNDERIEKLESEIETLRAELAELKEQFDKFKKQFE